VRAATSGSDVHLTRIEAPDLNRKAFEAAANDPRYADYQLDSRFLRYNDLIHIDGPEGSALLASYTEYHPDKYCYTNTLARLDIDASVTDIDSVEAKASDWTVVYRSKPCLPLKKRHLAIEGHTAGGELAFLPPSTVLMTAGDFHWDGTRSDADQTLAQDPQAEYGKIMAIDLVTLATRVMTTGHRNPQGIVVLPDGRIFAVEHGPRGGDEVNLIHEGKNYGWPLQSYGTTYFGALPLPNSLSFARHDMFEPPVYAWVPSVAASGVAYLKGFHPTWDGDLIVGTLKDESIFRLRLQGDRVVYSERIPIGSRVHEVHLHTDGRLVLWTSKAELIFLSGEEKSNIERLLKDFQSRRNLPEALAAKVGAAVERCSECHSFENGDDANAPNLARVHGGAIAGTAYTGYSTALKNRGGTWNAKALSAFIKDPQKFAPGSSMPNPGIRDSEVIEGVVEFLDFRARAF
jgi:cytochrome c2